MFREHAFDFGRDNNQEPEKIFCPTTTEDIKQIIDGTGLTKIAIRGKGHSTGGQALVDKGIVIDMTSCAAIGAITINKSGKPIVEVQAGASWKSVFNHCLAEGLMPPTYADWLDLTVGGPLSTGGIGQCTFKKGMQIDNVECLEVITGQGDVIICNNQENKDLFDLIRGGLGQYGIISRAWIHLEKAPENVFVYKLLYTDLQEFLNAQTELTTYQQIDAIQSHVIHGEQADLSRCIGLPISDELYKELSKQPQYFLLEVTKYVRDDDCSTLESFKEFLSSATKRDVSFIFAREAKLKEHVNRVPPLLSNPLEKDFPKHHHCCFFIAAKNANQLLAELFSDTTHCAAMGRGNILIIPMKRSKINVSYLRLPEAEDIFFIGILRRHLDPCPFETLINLNEQTYKRTEELGGYVYPVGSGSFLSDSHYWKRYHGENFDAVLRGKVTYDPKFRLTPNIKMFSDKLQKKI